MAKPPATAVSKYDNRASVPVPGRRLFLCRFTPFHLRFRHLLPVFQDSKARGGIRRNGSKDLSQVSGRSVFVLEGETGISGTVHHCFSAYLRFIGASEKSHLVKEGKMLCNN